MFLIQNRIDRDITLNKGEIIPAKGSKVINRDLDDQIQTLVRNRAIIVTISPPKNIRSRKKVTADQEENTKTSKDKSQSVSD